MRQELFTDDLAKEYALREGILFISDVRTSKDDEFHPSQAVIEEDMKLQMSWHLLMKPLASSFKFRLPWGAGRTHYLNGTIFLPVWGPETTTESRLFVESGGSEAECLKTYDNEKYEQQMFYFNTHRRIAKYKHEYLDYFRCACFDCTSEAAILQGYMDHLGVPAALEEIQDVPTLSRWLHKECH
ncbi:Cap-specific mRNA (nucleoside-2'-O-)-methyltransferase(Poly(A) polymerase regulatory subunit) (Poly(A) polymerase small subunit) (PAP-S) (VP39), partial [Durusdinium trenchii]